MAIRAIYRDEEGGRRGAAELCLKCGVCCNVAHSCHVMNDLKFNPRYTFVYDCLASEKEASNPNIWLCVSCHKCEETCPYEVSPIHFIESLKGDALQLGWVHQTIRAEVTQIVTTGYAFPITGATERQRQALNLRPLPPPPVADLAKIVERTLLTERLREVRE